MKKLIFISLFLIIGNNIFSQNTAASGNTWYKIISKGKFLTKIRAWGHYAEHEVVVHLINTHWNTSEVQYISEFNYDHNRIKLEWGYVGSGSYRYMAVRVVPVTADYASGFEFTDVVDSNFDYALEAIDASLVTPIAPKTSPFVNEWAGNIGIGTATPLVKLDIEGGDLYVGEEASVNGNRREIRIYGFDNGVKHYGSLHSNYDESKRTFDINTNDYVQQIKIDASANSTANILLNPGISGKVGIGTTTPDSKLTVAGNIHAQEVKVTVNAGADFVFHDDYNLPKLEEVEQFIKENKHLPEIASEIDMQANGIHLAEMNIKLLQKIEELTLYTIEQQKQIGNLFNKVEELQDKLNHK
ncbi:hypothetical protein CJ739_1598 [Mariniflexile rhizosphaerae]|uniref:tail fiber protein n=1 Tax=unclassified Mariniflexile TaxID=2643887 RepID=UPI000CC9681D|nr:tail fiber protein [Mariniflexile sp. TRM1-10]AXP80685.1 hypothetical protein CJ739_1598 [Mariniflexile sp. TRM1-10]PLB17863.1 MAG: hypothetical protein TRG1_3313 [Flavobacteriaceae bacterium FS1-H7996/R]